MPRLLDVQFLGAEFDKMIGETLQTIDPVKWQKKKNSTIMKALKSSARYILPVVWRKMRNDTGAMRMFTDIKRLSKGGGWRIYSPRREELAVKHPEVLNSKGYYPAAMEYGFKSKKDGRKIEGNRAMGEAMDQSREHALSIVRSEIQLKLERDMKRHLKRMNK